MNLDEIRVMVLDHEKRVTVVETYFKVLIGIGACTIPILVYLVVVSIIGR